MEKLNEQVGVQKIDEEMGVHKAWKEEAKQVKNTEELNKFINHLINDYEHDYGTIVHAMFAGMMATWRVMEESHNGGITGFQAGCLGHMFVKEFLSPGRIYKIQCMDNLLYPQYENKFRKVLKPKIWEALQEMAQKNLDENAMAHPDVVAHWKKVIAGEVPFGFTVSEEDE